MEDLGPGEMCLEPCLTTIMAAKYRTMAAFCSFSIVISSNGTVGSASPAVKTMWSTFPTLAKSCSTFLSTSAELRSQAWAEMRDLAEG